MLLLNVEENDPSEKAPRSALPCSQSVGWQEQAVGQPALVSGSSSGALQGLAFLCFSVSLVNHGIVPSYSGKHSLETNFRAQVTTENKNIGFNTFLGRRTLLGSGQRVGPSLA